MVRRNKKILAVLLCVLLIGLPCMIYASEHYDTLNASVPVTFFSKRDGADSVAVMEPLNDAPSPFVKELEFSGSGTSAFDISINEPGTYRYKVYQRPGTDTGIDYDKTVYTVIVFVAVDPSDPDGLKYSVTALSSVTGEKPDKIEFENDVLGDNDPDDNKDSSGDKGNDDKKDSSGEKDDEDRNRDSTSTKDKTERTRSGSGKSSPLNKDSSLVTEDESEITSSENVTRSENETEQVSENTENKTETNTKEDRNSTFGRDDTDSKDGSDSDKTDNETPGGGQNTTPPTETAVETGDSSNQGLWITLMGVSLAVIVLTTAAEKTEKRKLKRA